MMAIVRPFSCEMSHGALHVRLWTDGGLLMQVAKDQQLLSLALKHCSPHRPLALPEW